MNGVVDLTVIQLASAYIFVILLLFIVKIKGIKREREILIASIRMTIQLMLMGYVLAYVFETKSVVLTFLIIVGMLIFAIFNIYNRIKVSIPHVLKRIIALSMAVGTTLALLYFMLIVIQPAPWHEPRYFIPIAGMIIGNSMTGVNLGVQQIIEGFNSKKHVVEAALMMGARPQIAAKNIVNNAFDSAIIPTINSMMGLGIVFLPGLMTGQILAGLSPLTAIGYQIAIMLGIVGSVTLTVIIFLQLGYRSFFNHYCQLKEL